MRNIDLEALFSAQKKAEPETETEFWSRWKSSGEFEISKVVSNSHESIVPLVFSTSA